MLDQQQSGRCVRSVVYVVSGKRLAAAMSRLWVQAHQQIAAGAQHEERLRLCLDAGHQVQLKALRDAGDDQAGLHQAEVVADALARPRSKWHVGTRPASQRSTWR